MKISNLPTRISTAWASGAANGYVRTIPLTSQIGVNLGQASWPDGFVPQNTLASGGPTKAPSIQDFNGVLNALSLVQQWQCGGGFFPYDSAWATLNGGYAKGAIITRSGGVGLWVSLVNDNMVNPDTTASANWADLENMYYAVDTGSAGNAYVVNYPLSMGFMADGMIFRFRAYLANSDSATITINGLGPYPLYTLQHNPLSGGEIQSNGTVEIVWNSSLNSGNGGFVVLASSGGAQAYAPGEVRFFTTRTAPAGFIKCNGALLSRTKYAALFAALVKSSSVTISVATPGVVAWTGVSDQIPRANDPVKFSTTGALPTGLVAGTTYYVVSSSIAIVATAGFITGVRFSVSATPGGAAIATTGTQSGTHTGVSAPYGDGDGSTTFAVPDYRGEFFRGWDDGRGIDTNRTNGSFQAEQIQKHKHAAPFSEAGWQPFGASYGGSGGSAGGLDSDNPMAWTNDGTEIGGNQMNPTGLIGTETRPRNFSLLACIKY